MATRPTITYSNVKHKVIGGVSGGNFTYNDEDISVLFNGGVGGSTSYKVSCNSPFNQITGQFTSSIALTRFEIRVNPIEEEEYGPNIGNLVCMELGISANTAKSFSFTISTSTFNGSPTNTYRVCLLSQAQSDYTWDYTALFMVINNSFTDLYKEVEYLSFSRDSNPCCIDTGVTMQKTYSIETAMELTNTSGDNQFLFSDRSSSGGYFHVYVAPSRFATYQSPNVGTITMALNQKYIFRKVGTSCYVDSTYYGESGTSTQTTRTLLIGCVDSTTNTRGFYGKCYYFKIYDANKSLLRCFIPCVRKSDSVPGMFDTVNEVFYQNTASGSFTAGPEIELPAAYQEIEYLESTGSQYINTGFILDFNTRVVCDMALTSQTTGIMLWGAIGSTPNILEYSCYVNSSKIRPYFQVNSSTYYQFYSDTLLTNQLIHIDFDVKPDKQQIVTSQGSNAYTYDKTFNLTTSNTSDHNMFIFASSTNSGGVGWPGASKLYNMKIYKNDELVRYFIPCYRKSDSKPGLYDLVNDVFYVNQASGTEFTMGPACENMRSVNAYEKFVPTGADGFAV